MCLILIKIGRNEIFLLCALFISRHTTCTFCSNSNFRIVAIEPVRMKRAERKVCEIDHHGIRNNCTTGKDLKPTINNSISLVLGYSPLSVYDFNLYMIYESLLPIILVVLYICTFFSGKM